MTAKNTVKAARRNDVAAIDFNKEVKDVMTQTNKSDGRELRLAIAIYGEPQNFNVVSLLSAERKTRIEKLKSMSQAYADAFSRIEAAQKESKASKNLARQVTLAHQIADDKNATNAALAMFERALLGARYLKETSAIIVTRTDTHVTIKYAKPIPSEEKGAPAKTDDILRVGELRKLGKSIHDKASPKPAGKSKAKSDDAKGKIGLAKLAEAKAIPDAANVLADTMSAIPPEKARDFSVSEGSEKLLAVMLRQRFAADNVIMIEDVMSFMREHVKGVRFERKTNQQKVS